MKFVKTLGVSLASIALYWLLSSYGTTAGRFILDTVNPPPPVLSEPAKNVIECLKIRPSVWQLQENGGLYQPAGDMEIVPSDRLSPDTRSNYPMTVRAKLENRQLPKFTKADMLEITKAAQETIDSIQSVEIERHTSRLPLPSKQAVYKTDAQLADSLIERLPAPTPKPGK